MEFYLPPVGTVAITLHDESARIYRWLQDVGEIDRLKTLDHLGAVRLAWQGASHSRWEYIVFLWSLIDRCREAEEVHVSSGVQLADRSTVTSGLELMKCWALLLNVGHLVWTFAAERALLFELWEHRSTREAFPLLVADDESVRDWAAEILRAGRYYQLFHALAFIRLRSFPDAGADRLAWEPILRAHVLNHPTEPPGLVKLRSIYRQLRRLAYLALDTQFTPSVVRVDPRQLVTDARALGRLVSAVLRDEETDDELTALERSLYQHIYLAEPVIAAIAAREVELRTRIRRSLRHKDVLSTVEALARGELQREVEPRRTSTLVRLPVWVTRPFDELLSPALNPRTFQSRWTRDLGQSKANVRISAWTVPYGRDWVFQVDLATPESGAGILGFRQAFDVTAWLRERNRWLIELVGEDSVHEWILEPLAAALVAGALRMLGRARGLRWEWGRSGRGLTALFVDGRTAAQHAIKLSKGDELAEDRRHALEGLHHLLKKVRRGLVAVALSPLTGYDSSSRQVVELDGCIVDWVNEVLRVTLVEVKRRRTGGARAAREQLTRALAQLGIGGAQVSVDRYGRLSAAWAEILMGGSPCSAGG